MKPSTGPFERFVRSFAFSLVCFVLWGGLTVLRARSLWRTFSWMELVWLVYTAGLAVLSLVRTRPRLVSLDPVHWIVALTTSFSGFLFESRSAGVALPPALADAVILSGLLLSAWAAVGLRRSYDFLPALRGVATGGPYRFVRHPMYAAAILIRFGYLLRHTSFVNMAVFMAMTLLYARRARYEEQIMAADEDYRGYLARVPSRFVPGMRF